MYLRIIVQARNLLSYRYNNGVCHNLKVNVIGPLLGIAEVDASLRCQVFSHKIHVNGPPKNFVPVCQQTHIIFRDYWCGAERGTEGWKSRCRLFYKCYTTLFHFISLLKQILVNFTTALTHFIFKNVANVCES